MVARHEILCINKSARVDPHERITHTGGEIPTEAGGVSRNTPQQKVSKGKWQFYVTKNNHTGKVIIAPSRFGKKYTKTANDGVSQTTF